MGLDIHLSTTNETEITGNPDYHDLYFYKHSLSRTFCWLMSRRDVLVSGEPELDQIGKITGTDISPLYDMNSYPSDEETSFFLERADSEEEKQTILLRAETAKARLKGNLDTILRLIDDLFSILIQIDNLPERLAYTDRDTLNNAVYFANFNRDEGNGYIYNNFGHDLRNFKNYLEYIKSKGRSTVYFRYG